ncbi:MAG: SulP family inorganic anion transporter, partial [Pseudomonadota bacterium]|nr:SulP family inorganic anion transporter [Pseudomonadota bacterium]
AVLGAATLALAGSNGVLRAGLAAGLVLATGLAFLVAGVARLGSISNFISKPVLRGFSFGLALTIVIRQLPNIVGVHPAATGLAEFTWQLAQALPHWNWLGVAFGVGAWASLRLLARFGRIPGALFVIAAGIGLGAWLDAGGHGVGQVGRIALGLPALDWPSLTRGQWSNVGELALGMMLLLFAESYGAIRGMAIKHGDAVAPDRDLIALGAANVLSGLFQGLPVGAGFSATSANEAAGARSGRAAWAAAAVVLLLVVVCLPWIERLPEPVLAAVVLHAVSHTLTLDVFRPYFRWRRDRLVVVAAAAAVMVLGVLNGLLAGVAISLVMTLRGLSTPLVTELGRRGDGHDFLSLRGHPEVRRVPGLLLLRPEAPLFFANVERVLAELRERVGQTEGRHLIVSLEETPDLDGTTVEALAGFATEMAHAGVSLCLARLKDPVLALLTTTLGATAARLEGGSVDDAVVGLFGTLGAPNPGGPRGPDSPGADG